MVGEHAIHNGQLIATQEAVVPVTLRAVLFGFTTYESLRVIKGHPVHLVDHLNRLEASCKGIGLTHPFSGGQIEGWVYRLIEADEIEDASMRIQLYGGNEPHLFVLASTILSYPDSYYTEGVGAITYEGERLFPSCKTGNLLLNYLALEQAKAQNCFEALLVDRNGRVLEGTRSNFFAFEGNKLYTAGDAQVLLGITRDRVLKAAELLGCTIVYEAPQKAELAQGRFEEVFISATSMAAMPLSKVDRRTLHGPFDRTLAIMRTVRAWELDD